MRKQPHKVHKGVTRLSYADGNVRKFEYPISRDICNRRGMKRQSEPDSEDREDIRMGTDEEKDRNYEGGVSSTDGWEGEEEGT
jgi:hypothetical protein